MHGTEPESYAETGAERLLAITQDVLRARDHVTALASIANGVHDVFGFRYVTIVAADTKGADLYRRILLGYPEETRQARLGERVPREEILNILDPSFEVFENCYFFPAENEVQWKRGITTSPRDAFLPRKSANAWHERDVLCLVLRDVDGELLGYLSVDHPQDGLIPTRATLRSIQIYVNLVGLALANVRAHMAEIERNRYLAASEAKFRHEALHDALTRLPNRQQFSSVLEHELDRARSGEAYGGFPACVLFIDLDEFKAINDAFGHAAGDAVLVELGRRLAFAVAPGDMVARLGGDEFAILLSPRPSREDVVADVMRITDALVAPLEVGGRAVYNTASIGIAPLFSAYAGITDVLRDADTAMYVAKSLGHGRHVFFDQSMHTAATERLALSTELRHAIEENEFVVAYQPIVTLSEERTIVAFEALVRWQHPRRGRIMPADFIPFAEDVGAIVPIGRFVLAESCRMLAKFGVAVNNARPLGMHVNLSVQEILQPDLPEFLAQCMGDNGIDPGRIAIEITESAILRGGASANALDRIRALGVSLCIDDFGTGYSALRYLSQYPVDALKIDRSFVESADGSLGSAPIVRMLIELARSYGLRVVAEGIETAAQATELFALACPLGQGYYYYRPIDGDACEALLRAG
jgi:diguanylate cyclase (GGDEF)-like protein